MKACTRVFWPSAQALGHALAQIPLSPFDDNTFSSLATEASRVVRAHTTEGVLQQVSSVRTGSLSFLLLHGMPLSTDNSEWTTRHVSEKCMIGVSSLIGATIDFTLAKNSPIIPLENNSRITRISPLTNQAPEPCPWHQDLAFLTRPPDAVTLFCLRKDPQDGGTTFLLDMRDIVECLEPHEDEFLRQPLFELLPPPYFAGTFPTEQRPLLVGPAENPVLRVSLRSNIIAEEHVVAQAINSITRACETAAAKGKVINLKFQPGDMLLINNNMAMHTRTGKLQVCPENRTQRLLYRMWLRFTENGNLTLQDPYQ